MERMRSFTKRAISEHDSRYFDAGFAYIGKKIAAIVNGMDCADLPLIIAALEMSTPMLKQMLTPSGKELVEKLKKERAVIGVVATDKEKG